MNLQTLVLYFFLLCGLNSCTYESNEKNISTNTRSEIFKTAPERISFLKQYYEVEEGVEDAAYSIVYHDNSGGMVPGPSDWYYSIALKYKEDAFEKVKSNFNGEPKDSVNLSAWDDILPKNELWQTTGPYIESKSSVLVLKHRIKLFTISTNPSYD